MKIYLAGKVSKHDWRHDIVGDALRAADANGNWENECIRFLGEHVYTGPFFVGCDHGCSHSFGEHGITTEMCSPDRLADGVAGFCDLERATRSPGPDIASGENDRYNRRRAEVINKCKAAINSSDLVFAWLDDPTAHGTLWELGYAAGRGIQTAIGIPGHLDVSDMWFPVYGAGQVYRSTKPLGALIRSIGKIDTKLLFHKCESPIESALLSEMLVIKPADVLLFAQHEVDRYRLDFALVGPGGRVAVECDGHDFHERTKEQAKRDRQRDRTLTMKGWTVARFTGSEIHADAAKCAREAVRMLSVAQ